MRPQATGAIATAALLACAHAQKARPEQTSEGQQAGEQVPSGKRVQSRPGGPELSTSPEGLLRPGGAALIQDALAKRGYLGAHEKDRLDEATSAAIRKFQRDQKLAETGVPDDETIVKLDLDPKQVFRGQSERGASR